MDSGEVGRIVPQTALFLKWHCWRFGRSFRSGERLLSSAITTQSAPNSSPTIRWEKYCVRVLALLTLAFFWITVLRRSPDRNDFALILLTTPVLTLVRLFPVSRTRDYPLTFMAPAVFAVLLWSNSVVASVSALIALLIHARGTDPLFPTRRAARYYAFQLSFAALFAGMLAPSLPLSLTPHFSALWEAASGAAARRAALFSSALFTTSSLLAAALFYFPALSQSRRKRAEVLTFLRHKATIYFFGMVPMVVLAPLGAAFGASVIGPVALLLAFAAATLKTRIEVETLKEQLKTAEAMGRASVTQPEELTPEAVLHRFLVLGRDLVSADRAIVWAINEETGLLTPVTGLPNMGLYHGEKIQFGEGLLGHAAARMRPRLIADAAKDPRRGRREIASGAWLLYPIIVHERLMGVGQWIRSTAHPYTEDDIARLDALVPQAAVAWENVRIRETMHQLAATDGLTGLWNQRKMTAVLREEMRRSGRYHRPLSVLMFDVDSFKSFNDTYGHPKGDQLLRNIASILKENVRTVDYAGRYGGEEFIVVLPETSKDDACRMAERVRYSVETYAMVQIDGQDIHRTVSVGVASYPEDALNPAEIVQRADEALYRAKRSGKNCVIWA